MKKLTILALAIMGLMVAACSSDKEVADVPETPENPGVEFDGTGYFKVNIKLPTAVVTSTRANNDQFDDGLDTEYAVDNVLLLLFEGTSESTATLKQVVDLTADWAKNDDDPNQITTSGTSVVELNSRPGSGNSLYALAILNRSDIITQGSVENTIRIKGLTGDYGPTKTDLTIGLLQNATGHGSVSSADVLTNDFVYTKDEKTYFFMTNAALSTVGSKKDEAPASVAIQVLAPVSTDANHLKSTEEAAATAEPATNIYVERGVAKVTLNTEGSTALSTVKEGTTSYFTVKLDGSNTVLAKAEILGWTIDNTNTTSYIVHTLPSDFASTIAPLTSNKAIDTDDEYRFVGPNPVESGVSLYRTYWAEDPNYNVAWASGAFKSATAVDQAATMTVGSETVAKPLYCLENTFPVTYQTFQNTTRAILKVRLTDNGSNTGVDFFTIGDDRNTLYSETELKKVVIADLFNNPNFTAWYAKKGGGSTLDASKVTVTLDYTEAESKAKTKVTTIKIDKSAFSTPPSDDITINSTSSDTEGGVTLTGSDVLGVLNAQLKKVNYYAGGVVYYTVRIQHFGDELTPWNDGEYTTGNEPAEGAIDKIYPTSPGQNANYLGRYGMVRNNWYDLALGKVLKIGSPTVPVINSDTTPTDPDPDDPDPKHPDDELSLYIQARINILSWAKRTQGWNLK